MPDHAGLTQRVDSLFAPFDRPDAPGCAVAAIRGGQVLYAHGYGAADLEHRVPITPDTRFYVASVSKQFTAMSIALLARRGALTLDDDVRKWLPELPDFGAPITIRQLLWHTSGVRSFGDLMEVLDWPGAAAGDWHMSQAQFLAMMVRQRELNFRPGTDHLYSNNGYWLLALIVRRAGGQSLRDFASAEIFRPLGMTSSSFRDDHTALIPDRALPYVTRDSGGFAMQGPESDLVGAGGLFTTVGDLARWEGNFYSPIVGDSALVAMLQAPGRLTTGETLAYAMGLRLRVYRGLSTVEHGGVYAGYNAQLIRFPAQRFSVATLCNTDQASPRVLSTRVADIYLAREMAAAARVTADLARAPRAGHTDVGAASSAVGMYWNDATGAIARLSMRGDTLLLTDGQSGPTHTLRSVVPGTFDVGAVLAPEQIVLRGEGAARTFERHVAGLPVRRFVRVREPQPTTATLAPLAGTYVSPEFDPAAATVTLHESSIVLQIGSATSVPMQRIAENVFVAGDYTVRFAPDSARGTTSLLLTTELTRNLRFVRR